MSCVESRSSTENSCPSPLALDQCRISDIGFVGDTCFDGPSVLVHVEGCNGCDWLHGSSGSHDGRRSGGRAIVTVVVVVVVWCVNNIK